MTIINKYHEGEFDSYFTTSSGKIYNLNILAQEEGYLYQEYFTNDDLEILITSKDDILFIDNNQNKFEIAIDGIVKNTFIIKNLNIIVSLIKANKHFISVFSKDGTLLSNSEVGLNSWHSQSAISQSDDGTIMFATYPINGVDDAIINPAIFRSIDYGINWERVLKIKFPKIRHFHTLINLGGPEWLATSGDEPNQSLWLLTRDNGINWLDFTDYTYNFENNPKRSQSIHRTTTMIEKDGRIYSATDDMMGKPKQYFALDKHANRKATSLFYSAEKKDTHYKIENIFSLGMHIRSMIPCKDGIVMISEGQNPSYDFQIFFSEWKNNKQPPLHIGTIKSSKKSGGTNSRHSLPNKDGIFYTRVKYKAFFGHPTSILRWNLKEVEEYPKELLKNISDNYLLQQNLWTIEGIKNIYKILFTNNNLIINLEGKNKTNSVKLIQQVSEINDFIGISQYLITASFEIPRGINLSLVIEHYNLDNTIKDLERFEIKTPDIEIYGYFRYQKIRLMFMFEFESKDKKFRAVKISNLRINYN
jgi:hypothetical protein